MQIAARYFCLALLVRIAWAACIPAMDAPDEAAHLRTIRFFSERMRLATAEEIASGAHGYYIAGSPLPHLPFVLVDRAARALTGAEAPLFAFRLAAALCGALLVALSSLIARRLFADHPLQWALPLACAFHPQLAFVTAHVGWDALSILAATALIATWPALLAHPLTPRLAAIAGATAGCVLLVKPTSFCVLPVHAALFISAALRLRGARAMHLSIAAITCALIAAPFMIHNWRLFPGDPFAISPILHTQGIDWEPGRPAQGEGPFFLLFGTRFLLNTFESAWGLFGYMTVKLPNTVYALIAASCAAALIGLSRRPSLTPVQRQFSIAGACALAFAFASSYWTNVANDYQPQGRYFFAAVVPLISLWLTGLAALVDRPARSLAIIVTLLGALNVFSLLLVRAHA